MLRLGTKFAAGDTVDDDTAQMPNVVMYALDFREYYGKSERLECNNCNRKSYAHIHLLHQIGCYLLHIASWCYYMHEAT